MLLADEVNRTPPKTQAALLEAMQEHQVTVDGESHALPVAVPRPRHPEPDRVRGHVPAARGAARPLPRSRPTSATRRRQDEVALLGLARDGLQPSAINDIKPVAKAKALLDARKDVEKVSVTAEVQEFIVAVGAPDARAAVDDARRLAARGGPSVDGIASAALLAGRDFVTPDDIVDLAVPVLAHRLVLTPEAELERFTQADAISGRAGGGAGSQMSPSPRAAALVAVAALLALLIPSRLAILLAVAVVGAVVADALAAGRKAKVQRKVPRILSRGVGVPVSIGVSGLALGSSVRVRQPGVPDVDVEPQEGGGGLETVVTARRRGRHVLPRPALRTEGPMGLGRRHLRDGEDEELIVYPDMVAGEDPRPGRAPRALSRCRDEVPRADRPRHRLRARARLPAR